MGRALLSTFLHDLLHNLLLLTSKPFIIKPPKYQRKLIATLRMLDTFIDDTEEKQFATKTGQVQLVKDWLKKLQYAVYSLEEIICQWQVTTTTTTYTNLFGVFSKVIKPNSDLKIEICDIMNLLVDLVKMTDVLGLTRRVTWKESLRGMFSCSIVLDNYFYGNYPKDYFYGREQEEKSMLEVLLSTTSEQHVKVINIEAKGGAGKTAFTDVIYFNHKVRECFELRAWVNVPYKAKVSFIAKKILEAVTEEFVPGNDLHELSKKLKESFEGKKFLLVLDDIRIEDEDATKNWNMLVDSLFEAATGGSAIILTLNPDDDSLLVPQANHTIHLGMLSSENSWSIFLVHAFGQMDLNEYPELVAVGKEIVNRLGNLPLAAKMIGSLLQDKVHLSEWVDILRSKLIDEGDVNLPIPAFLVLCYLDLPAELKRCFAYLSLFPKGYEFKQQEVVLLWMAQGFLQNLNSKSNHKSMEDIGDEYFGYLMMRSFLQPFASGISFTMHNLVHDLATYVFGESYNHHLSYSRTTHDFPESLSYRKGKLLKTILPVCLPLERAPSHIRPSVLEDITLQLNPQFFRTLSLSHYDITNLPNSVGRLSHLCYLDLSHTALQTLPDSICNLLNLQTLRLTNCSSLKSFPPRICNLTNLRCLDVRDSGVQEMPLQMNKMTSLRTLTDFVVSEKETRLEGLSSLSNLKTLTISKLKNVAFAMDASNVKLKEKKSLDDLMLQFGNVEDVNGNETKVLENLEPHRGLTRLTVEYYGGVRFPNWLGDPSYWSLQLVDLRHCKNCDSLPTLGQLPLLKDLFIEGFTKVSTIGHEFYGTMSASHKPFQSLETLQFWDMLEWTEWNIFEGVEFPYLIELYIIRCPKLERNLPKQLPSLQKLEISGCHDLVAPLPKVSNTCEVFVHDSNEALMRNVAKTHSQASLRRHVVISEEVQEITPQSYSGFPSNKYTIGSSLGEIEEIAHEERMEIEFPRNRLPPSVLRHQVETDDISRIKEQTDPQSSLTKDKIPMTTQADTSNTTTAEDHRRSQDIDDERSSFEILKVTTVSQLRLLPHNLHSLKIEGCELLEVLPSDLLGRLPVLRELYLVSCSSLRSFPYPTSLETLYIRKCRTLELVPSLEKIAFLQHLFIGNSCDSLTTLNLNLFPKLKILCIWDCHNLLSLGEFSCDLASLESIEIRDCTGLRSFPDEGLHTPNLASMFLSNSNNLTKLPNSMNSLTSLKSLYIHRCPLIESFPLGGLPSSLTLLSISHCDKLTPRKNWGLENLESLTHFEIEGGCIGMETFPAEKILPRNIISLRISKLKCLRKLDYNGFQHLNALHTLEINSCEILRSLPEQGFPSSLEQFSIQECPMLTPRLKPKIGKEWHKVACILHIQIDGQVLS
ncbi:putative disease resistance protein At3g14460 [Trifolium pratense]|uniref:putative disease resistance protein At3g14460 n=1 Tax=Trifolium pratense TaxID=57577 RepID=UPI001E696F24|nr:putative disease resistance protein At3g14460 [Trifolium pratense]